ncbi:glycosyl transferase [Luteitalea sp. TBR-22]|uniref:glycosyltransferase n=1 Tax=Luteitalea sp. TBR-22 TaxID=2802971 RepID=UPI001AF56F4F|nr:nucleotide disphospho-sugar-binding domain-containing protein [Luteitalea sp. TBR-22]BCS32524.1 glycosyl transferase [Luteitalea sp. TBR-22]
MSTFLFTLVDGGGNVPAQLAIARRLAGRGHTVHVLADRVLADAVESAGCRFLTWTCAPQHNMRDRAADTVRDWEPSSPPAQLRRIGEQVMFGPASRYARDVLDAIDRTTPQALAVDCLLFGAMAAAERSRLPAATLFHYPFHAPVEGFTPLGFGLKPARSVLGRARDAVMLGLARRVFAFGLPPLNEARVALGLPPVAFVFEQLLRLPRALVLTSREYDFVPSGLPAHVRYVGPQLDDPSWPEPWSSPWPDDAGEPLVLVSLGSTYQRQDEAFRRIVEALGALPVRGLATLGSLAAPSWAPPPNVRLVASARHASVLPHASAVVCHGGHGTVLKSLAHGLPVLVMPFGRDQKDNGARVEACGAGLVTSPRASTQRIASDLRRLLEEGGFREAARRMAEVIARDVREDRAVAEMEALASTLPAASP